MIFKSKQQLDRERPEFLPLPSDDYELIITNLEPMTRNRYMAKPNKDGKIPQEEIFRVTLEIVAFRDGGNAIDIRGNDATGRKIFFTLRPNSMGFQQDGTPSKSRTLVAYATNQNVEDEIELDDWQDLIGKTIFAEIIQYTNSKGKIGNKISRFLLPPKSKRQPIVDIKDEEIPIIE